MDNFKSYANVGIEGGIISPSSTTINQAIYDMCKYIKENAKQGYSIINVQCNKVNTLGLVDYYNLVIDTNEPKTFTYTFTVTNGEKGDSGDTGYYINNVTINKISSQGLVDTYKILFHSTSGDTYEIEFNITNGKSFNWIGEWIADNEYREDDVVYYNGSSYICKSDIIGSETTPDVDTANWLLMCKQGIQGEKGEAATIKIGTVTTLPAGSEVTVENVGTNNNAIFNFGIPKGEKGDTGGQEIIDLGNQQLNTNFKITKENFDKFNGDNPPIIKIETVMFGNLLYRLLLSRSVVRGAYIKYSCTFIDDAYNHSGECLITLMISKNLTATLEFRQLHETNIQFNSGDNFKNILLENHSLLGNGKFVGGKWNGMPQLKIKYTISNNEEETTEELQCLLNTLPTIMGNNRLVIPCTIINTEQPNKPLYYGGCIFGNYTFEGGQDVYYIEVFDYLKTYTEAMKIVDKEITCVEDFSLTLYQIIEE